jgi:hypothetical protein
MRYRALAVLAVAGFLTACDSTPTTPTPAPTPPPPAPVVQSVAVAPATATVQAGQTTTLTATLTADAGITNRTINWSSSSTAVATVNSEGVVTGVTAGTATITATSAANPAISGTSVVTVTPRPTVFTDFNGVFEARGGVLKDDCSLGDPGNMRATVNLDATGAGTVLVWHDGNAFTTRYELGPATNQPISGNTFTFRANTSDSVVNGVYSITFLGSMTPTTVFFEELFGRSDSGCESRYRAETRR